MVESLSCSQWREDDIAKIDRCTENAEAGEVVIFEMMVRDLARDLPSGTF